MNFGIQPLMGRCSYDAEIRCFHNNTYSTKLTEMNIASHFQIISAPWELKLFAHFSKNGHTKSLHKILLLSLLLHQKHKHLGVDMPSSLSASIRGQCANQACAGADRICAVSTDGTSWTGRATSLIGCHSASVTQSPAIGQTDCTLTKKWIELWRSQIICK